MISREMKSFYYTLMGVPLAISGTIYRVALAPRSGLVRVHLGPGQKNYLPGWTNVDANFLTAKVDVWSDLRRALPFRSGTVDAFYSHHVIEHLPDQSLPFHLGEMFRCLKPGGSVRVGGPNGDSAIRKFIEGDKAWFPDFPDRRASIGGRFVNFVFCRGEHLTLLTESYLRELLVEAGFVDLRACSPAEETGTPAIFDDAVLGLEHEPDPACPHTLILEAKKP